MAVLVAANPQPANQQQPPVGQPAQNQAGGIGASAVPAAANNGNAGGGVGMAAVLAGNAAAQPGAGNMVVQPAAPGSMIAAPDEEKNGFARRSGTTTLRIPFQNDDQKNRYNELYDRLTQGHPDVVINLSTGALEENGIPIFTLNEDPNSEMAKDLKAMQDLYREVAGVAEGTDLGFWVYCLNDRAPKMAANPFEPRRASESLKSVPFKLDEIAKGPVTKTQLREYHTSKKLQRGMIDLLSKQIEKIQEIPNAPPGTESRKKRLAALREQSEQMDELVSGLHAKVPPPNWSGLPSLQLKSQALKDYKARIQTYLQEEVKNHKPTFRLPFTGESQEQIDQAIDQMATEMALLACTTRLDYLVGCKLLSEEDKEIQPCKTTLDLFVAKLSALLASEPSQQQIDTFLTKNLFIFLEGFTDEDKDAILGSLQDVIADIQNDWNDPELQNAPAGILSAQDATQYNRRVEQLAIVNKQQNIAKQLEELSEELRQNAPGSAQQLNNLKTTLNTLATNLKQVPSNDEAYRPLGEHILDTQNGMAQGMENVLGSLQMVNAANQGNLSPIIRKFRHAIEREKLFGTFLAEKGKMSLNPFHKKIELDLI